MAQCKSCGAEIEWLKTKSGKSLPVDKKPVWVQGSAGPFECFRTHFETCPNADQHRNQTPSAPPRPPAGYGAPADPPQKHNPEPELPF